MATRVQVLVPIAVAAFIVGIAGMLTIPSDVKLDQVEFPRGMVKINDIPLEVQIADNNPRITRGLMFQDPLPFDEGMLFVFEDLDVRSMWMLNMQFSLDILWFDESGNIVHIEKDMAPCKSALETVTCVSENAGGKPAKYVLEVTSGFVDRFEINEDSKLEIISI